MKKVTYAGQSFVTSDRVASTLLDYVGSMDRYGAGESIEIPCLVNSHAVGTALLLVWAGSEIMCVPQASDGPDPDLDVSVLSTRARMRTAYKRSEHSQHVTEDQDGVSDAF